MTVALDGNNPGGENDGAWAKGTKGYAGPNGRYASWDTLTDGVNAMAELLTSYIERGYNTPLDIANRWAPSKDGNNTAAYAALIAKGLHIGLQDKIPVADVMPLLLVQARIENAAFPAKWLAEQQRAKLAKQEEV